MASASCLRIRGFDAVSAAGVELERYVSFDSSEAAWELVREPPFIEEALRAGRLLQEEVDAWRTMCP